uniref:Secreted protein n=1 Tax=Rhipicephalus appendiculatus TaxID=34631 RepID=A0A131YD48_RHIAP
MVCTANFIVAKLALCVVCSSRAPVCLRYYEDHVPTSPNFNCVTSHLFRAVIRLMKYELAVVVRFCLCVCFRFSAQFLKHKSVIVA